MVDSEIKIRESGSNAGENLGLLPDPKKMENDIFRTGGMLENGKNSGHRATQVVGVEGHGDVNGGVLGGGGTSFSIAESWGLPEREFGGGGGGIGVAEEKEEVQEGAEERNCRGGGEEGDHPALIIAKMRKIWQQPLEAGKEKV